MSERETTHRTIPTTIPGTEQEPTRHPATQQLLRWFESGHLPDHLAAISQLLEPVAVAVVERCGEGPETTAGLRKLLEAKDCFVRARIAKERGNTNA